MSDAENTVSNVRSSVSGDSVPQAPPAAREVAARLPEAAREVPEVAPGTVAHPIGVRVAAVDSPQSRPGRRESVGGAPESAAVHGDSDGVSTERFVCAVESRAERGDRDTARAGSAAVDRVSAGGGSEAATRLPEATPGVSRRCGSEVSLHQRFAVRANPT